MKPFLLIAGVVLSLCIGCGGDDSNEQGDERSRLGQIQRALNGRLTGCVQARGGPDGSYDCDQGRFSLDDGEVSHTAIPQDQRPTPASPEAEIADRVNELVNALVEGDGPVACSFMTARGQLIQKQLAARLGRGKAETCEAAVREIGERVSDLPEDDRRRDVYPRTPGDVSIDSSGNHAQVAGQFRGAMQLRRVDGNWLVDVPGFFD